MRVEIRDIEMSAHVVSKINQKHGCTADDVWEACENALAAAWDDDPDRGFRLLIRGLTSQKRELRVVLYPLDIQLGRYRLGTAF
jgi:hypothetical protein